MANEGQPVDSAEFHPDDEIDELFARGNPNPTRQGCPSRDVLIALAKRELPISDPGYKHLASCSPCYQEARAYQAAQVRQRRAGVTRMVTWLATAALVVLGVAWLFLRARQGTSPSINVARQESRPADLQTELDLRSYVTSAFVDPISNSPCPLGSRTNMNGSRNAGTVYFQHCRVVLYGSPPVIAAAANGDSAVGGDTSDSTA